MVGGLAADLLGRHVADSAEHDTGLGVSEYGFAGGGGGEGE